MKRNGLLIILAMSSGMLSAALRTSNEALRIAGDFAGHVLMRRVPGRLPQAAAPSRVVASSDTYIAVNTSEGYVLVGADDRLPEVLGYGDNGGFDEAAMPPALRFWLQCYAEEAETATRPFEAPVWQSQATGAVEPLLSCQWNQSAPYNNMAPAYNESGSKAAAGCVATAMAQIMYYHRFPARGTATHSYLWVCTATPSLSKTLSANFGNTTYDWANMLDSYKNSYTTVQADAVATLMYHCGVAVDMGYGSSSGAYTNNVPKVLRDYFGYDANYQRVQKVVYSADSLNRIIHSELVSGRPVLVSGQNDEGGHAFVCDGADNYGYFHINWGWGGSNDGYYLLTALNPGKSQGIGGTTKGYNRSTSFYIGLQPAQQTTPVAIPQMADSTFIISDLSFTRSTAFSVSILKMQNFGLTNFSGYYGVGLYDEDEHELIAVLKQSDNYSLSAGYYRTTPATLSSIKIPSSVPDGNYHLCVIFKDGNYDWMRMMSTADDYYLSLSVEGNQVTIYPNDAEPEMALTQAISFGEGVNTDSIPVTGAPLSFAVMNTGGTFRGQVSARIYKGAFSKGQYEIVEDVVIRRNETFSSALQQAFDKSLLLDTQYKMKLCWRKDANDNWHDFTPSENNGLPFKLYDPEYHLTMPEAIRFDNNDSVPLSNANLYYSILNTGATFRGELQLFFYENGVYSRGQSALQEVTIGSGETLNGVFSGALEQQPGTYTVILRYRQTDGEWQDFTDVYGRNIGTVNAVLYSDQPEDPVIPTPLTRVQLPITDSSVLLMRVGAYFLYLVREGEGENVRYHKVFVPVR